jgi:hypothetical protein
MLKKIVMVHILLLASYTLSAMESEARVWTPKEIASAERMLDDDSVLGRDLDVVMSIDLDSLKEIDDKHLKEIAGSAVRAGNLMRRMYPEDLTEMGYRAETIYARVDAILKERAIQRLTEKNPHLNRAEAASAAHDERSLNNADLLPAPKILPAWHLNLHPSQAHPAACKRHFVDKKTLTVSPDLGALFDSN